jgi:prepilin-type N-terminal cleavage/methylation domain-containing protein
MQKIINRGFTLIELLVVIAIIGILASIVLVSLNGARGKSRDAQRVANLQQAAKIILAHASADTNTVFAPATAGNCGNTHHMVASTCTTPDLVSVKDPTTGLSACGAAAAATCEFSVSDAAGTGPANFNSWMIKSYLETGTGPYTSGPVCIKSTSNGILTGNVNCP